MPRTTTHRDHHYSITIHCDDLAIVGCLRALSQHCQTTGNARITWGGTKVDDWRTAGRRVTFRFSEPSYRDDFVVEAARILPKDSWTVERKSDNDPATPQ